MGTKRRRVPQPRRLPKPKHDEREELIAFMTYDAEWFRRMMRLEAWDDTPLNQDPVVFTYQAEVDACRERLLAKVEELAGFTYKALRAQDPEAWRKLEALYRRLGLDRPERYIREAVRRGEQQAAGGKEECDE